MLSNTWGKSSYSGGSGGNCVEARQQGNSENLVVQLRDSQLGAASPILSVPPSAFRRMLTALKTQ